MPQTLHAPLDAVQLARIEGIHRGFLYQHLYAAACVLRLAAQEQDRVLIEHDEDVQVSTKDGWIYLQVKYRAASAISPSVVEGVSDRFDAIRALHESGERTGTAQFYVVANRQPSDNLASDMEGWPTDVGFVHPASSGIEHIPMPSEDLLSMVEECRVLAARVPYSRLTPDTLVSKLVGYITLVATGHGGGGSHEIRADELVGLLEQFVVQLHRLPSLPEVLRPIDTPLDVDCDGVVVLEGYPGAGKTTWAAQVLRHVPRRSVYFDVSQAPIGGAVPALVREIVAVLGHGDQELSSGVLATGRSGLEALAFLNRYLADLSVRPMLVVDNVHEARVETLAKAVTLGTSFDWLVLGHPGEALRTFCMLTGASSSRLGGWSAYAAAAEAGAAGLEVDPGSAERLARLTEGSPLFVRSIVRLAASETAGNLRSFLDTLSDGRHLDRTDQERLLGRIARRLSPQAQHLLAILGLNETPIAVDVLEGLDSVDGVGSSLRELREWSIVETYPGRRVRLRDAFSPVSRELRDREPKESIRKTAGYLADCAWQVVSEGQGVEHLLNCLRLYRQSGQIDQLVSIATSDDEMFIELGLMPEIRQLLGEAGFDADLEPSLRIYALDSLAFWAIHEGDLEQAERLAAEAERLISGSKAAEAEAQRWLNKRLLIAGKKGDWNAAKQAADAILADQSIDVTVRNITVYNLAVAALSCRRWVDAESLCREAALAYFDVLDLDPADLAFATQERTYALLQQRGARRDDIKRLADALDLHARVRVRQGQHPRLAWLHAFKLYLAAGAVVSGIRVGQEVIDHLLSVGDIKGARDAMDSFILPAVRDLSLANAVVPVRGQYAVVLAFDGDIIAARHCLDELRPFVSALDVETRGGFETNCLLVEEIASGERPLPPLVQVPDSLRALLERGGVASSQPTPRVARKAPCPCGSGKKYKRCCGSTGRRRGRK